MGTRLSLHGIHEEAADAKEGSTACESHNASVTILLPPRQDFSVPVTVCITKVPMPSSLSAKLLTGEGVWLRIAICHGQAWGRSEKRPGILPVRRI